MAVRRAGRIGLAAGAGAVAAAAVAVALAAMATGGRHGVHVLAAASLADMARAVDPDARVAAGGSDQLAFQIENGIAADVYLSADPALTRRLHAAGRVGPPVTVATNRLVVIVPAGNPAGIAGARDVTRPGVRLVTGTGTVPVGVYTRRAFRALGLDATPANVVSREPDVKGVVAKVALGEADAGVVYATDARAAGDRVRTLPIPASAQPAVRYTAAVLTRAPRPAAGRAFIARLRAPAGRALLRAHGFGAAP